MRWEGSKAFLGARKPPHGLEVAPGCLSRAPQCAWDVFAPTCPVHRQLWQPALQRQMCQNCQVLPVGRCCACCTSLSWVQQVCDSQVGSAMLPSLELPRGGWDALSPEPELEWSSSLCITNLRFFLFLYFRNFDSLRKENVYENNKLVSDF